ncbi:MAG: adenine phosphoribosyltransferase [Pseudomonadota bacterium]
MNPNHDLKSLVRSLPDVPKAGVIFRDITTLLADPSGFRRTVDQMVHPYAGQQIDKIAGIEARGFILGGAIAHQLSVGFVPVRKKGKLPYKTLEQTYELEYGTDTVEIHVDMIERGEKVLLVDDLLATGGTALASIQLLERPGAEITGCCFVINLPDIGGFEKLSSAGYTVNTLMEFEGD